MGVKISELPVASTLIGTELLETVQLGTSKRTTIGSLLANLNVVQLDTATGILEVNGTPLVDVSVVTMSDLLALNAANYNNQKMIVTNPANAVSNFSPAEFFCTDSVFKMLGGMATLIELATSIRVTWPINAWSTGTLTLTSASSGTRVRVASAVAHGLTQANQVTAGKTNVYIAGSTGAESVPWTVGLTEITSVVDANTLELLHPYSASMKKPTIIGDIAGDASEIPVTRIIIPRLSTLYTGSFELEAMTRNHTVAPTRTRIRYGASGTSVSGAKEVFNTNDAAAALTSLRTRVINNGAFAKNMSTSSAISSLSGYTATVGAVPNVIDIDNTSATTDLLITANANATGADRTFELIAANVQWRF